MCYQFISDDHIAELLKILLDGGSEGWGHDTGGRCYRRMKTCLIHEVANLSAGNAHAHVVQGPPLGKR